MPGRFRADELVLPLDTPFDEDEALMAHVAVGIARAGGKMFEGRLLESRVGRLLGARFPRVGISPWDLRLADGTTIEVRSGTNRFSLRGPQAVDLWISCRSQQVRWFAMQTVSGTSSPPAQRSLPSPRRVAPCPYRRSPRCARCARSRT
jgi:hypothetical protein